MVDKTTEKFKTQQDRLRGISDQYKHNAQQRKTINILGISCSSINKDDEIQRVPSSEKVLLETIELAKQLDSRVESKIFKLRDIDFMQCEANYSVQGDYCTWPCWISQRFGDKDGLTGIYESLTDWCDIVLIATPIRRGNPSSLYFKLIERLNCIENQKEVYGVDLIHNQQAGFIIVGAQDGVQAVLGTMAQTWLQFGFGLPKNSFVGYTAGNFSNEHTELVAEQMQKDATMIRENALEMMKKQIEIVTLRRGEK